MHLVLREAHLTENMSRYLADRIERVPNIDVHCHSEVRELIGSRWLDAVVIEDIQTSERKTVEVKAVFVFIGAEPCTGWLRGQLDVDDAGFIRTGHSGSYLETSRPGVFAAGDVRSGSARRVASAVGDGAMVVRLVHEHLGAVRL